MVNEAIRGQSNTKLDCYTQDHNYLYIASEKFGGQETLPTTWRARLSLLSIDKAAKGLSLRPDFTNDDARENAQPIDKACSEPVHSRPVRAIIRLDLGNSS